jgi:hypothetical protein
MFALAGSGDCQRAAKTIGFDRIDGGYTNQKTGLTPGLDNYQILPRAAT